MELNRLVGNGKGMALRLREYGGGCCEALGHSSVAFTMDVYSHIIEGMQEDAMALLDEVLPPAKNRVKNKINAKLPNVRVKNG